MKKISSSIIAIFAALGMSAFTAQADQLKIGIASEPYPPFSSLDASGEWVGWEIEFIDAVCQEMKTDCQLTPIAWDGLIPALNGGKIDAIMNSMSITEERLKTIDFSDKYYKSPAHIVGGKTIDMGASPESLAGKVLGVQVSTIHLAYAQKHFEDAIIKEYQTQDEANQDLFSGRIDATMADGLALASFLTTAQGQACCEVKGAVKDDPSILGRGTGAGLRQGEDELKAKINSAITRVLESGQYQSITDKFFTAGFNLYGE